MSKIEDVARAIASAKLGQPVSDDMWQTMVRQYRELSIEPQYLNDRSLLMDSFREARAAIEALRTPTEAMLERGSCYETPDNPIAFNEGDIAGDVWRVMIEEALKDT